MWCRLLCFILLGIGVLLAPGYTATPAPLTDVEQKLQNAGLSTDGPSLLNYFRKRTPDPRLQEQLRPLVRELGNASFSAREQATTAIIALGPQVLPLLHQRALLSGVDLEGRRRIAHCQDQIIKQIVSGLLHRLEDESFAMREQGTAELIALGLPVLPLLRTQRRHSDPEIAIRVERCLREVEAGQGTHVSLAVARQLTAHPPEGAAAVLLAYLPFADSNLVAEQLRRTLTRIAGHDGPPDPALIVALDDPLPERRRVAATALAQVRQPVPPQVKALLRDPDPAVRLDVAFELVTRSHDREAVTVLIDALAEVSHIYTWAAEEALHRLAGPSAPAPVVGDEAADRRKRREGWMSWWQAHGATIDLAQLSRPAPWLGYTLIVLLDQKRIIDLDQKNQPRWQLDGLEQPLDVQLLPSERVLVAEHSGNRITERDHRNHVLWEHKIEGPLVAQRLSNGITFIATRSQLIEVDRDGREVYALVPRSQFGEAAQDGREVFALPWTDEEAVQIMRAQKLPTGEIACVINRGGNSASCVLLDPTGREVRSMPADVRTSGGRIEVLPNGNILVPELGNNRVVEYAPTGQIVWQLAIEQPVAALRLVSGHTLVTSMSQNRAVEVDQAGKEVWQYKADQRVTRALRH